MKKAQKLLAFVLALVMVLSLAPMVGAEEVLPLANADEVVVYYTNDIHTYIDKDLSYDNIAALKTATEAVAADVLLVDAGDHIQGTAYGSMDKGKTIIDLMNAAGYDLATLGNHEFDYGMDGAMNVIDWAEFPYVSCNFYHESDGVPGESVLAPYEIFEAGGMKIAFIGMTTPESFTKSTPAYFQDENGNYIYGIAGGEDGSALYEMVQSAIDAAEAEGVDYIIGLAHLGDDPASIPWTSEEVIANTTGLDAVIDGHSHSTVPMGTVADAEGNTVVLTQTGEYFDAIGRMVITADGIETGLITIAEVEDENGEVTDTYVALDGVDTGWELGSDAEVAAIKDAWITSINEQLGEVIGYADVTFDNYDAEGNRLVRKQETNTGDFAADALYYLFSETKGMDVDVAIMNGGGVRNKTITGELSYLTCKSIHTFGNVACLQTITGQQLLDALEWGARSTPDAECGGFLHVSGVTYEINTAIESGCLMDDKGVWTGHEGAYRVQNVKILQNGEYVDLDLEAEYNLAGYNYTLRDLGDGFAMFDGAVNVLDYVMEDYMVLANYVQSFPVDETTGLPTITADNSPYGSVYGEGRIKLVSEPAVPENPFTDVAEDKYYYDSVLWAYEKGVTSGTTATTFSPNESCTRAQIVTFLWNLAGKPEPKTTENPFTDVAEDKYYYDAVLWAYENGITSGVSKTAFAPNMTCTRAQAVTFLYRYAESPEVGEEKLPFTDVVEKSFYYDAVVWATAEKITAGTTATTFSPADTCTRAQIVSFLYRLENG